MNQDTTIKIGLLHSLSGTMSLSEKSLVDAELMAIEEINQSGGVLNRYIEPITMDGESIPEVFAKRARELFDSGIDTLFGAWTSASRKAIKPIVEAQKGLLFYPVQYEGLEESPNIIYTGSCLNQQISTSVLWALKNCGKNFFLVGSDYVFPLAANRLIRSIVQENEGKISGEAYFNLGFQEFNDVIQQIKKERPAVIFNTLNGDSNLGFFQQFRDAGLLPEDYPIMSVSLAETEVRAIGQSAVGHFACWGYFQSLKNDENLIFTRNFKQRYGDNTVCSAPMVMSYSQIFLWKKAVELAGTFEPLKVIEKIPGCSFQSPAGFISIGSNHHTAKSIRIGRVNTYGQFDIVWESESSISPKPWLGVEDIDFPRQALVKQCMTSFPDLLFQNSELGEQIKKSQDLENELKCLNAELEGLVENRTLQLKEMMEELRQAKEKAEEASRLKSSLLMNMSHELRTPINGILGFGELLIGSLDDHKQKVMVNNMVQMGRRLLVTFTSMMKISKLEADKVQPVLEICDIGDLIKRELYKIKTPASLKKILIKEQIDNGILLRIDKAMFSDILFFLLDNAIKYTDAGHLWVKLNQHFDDGMYHTSIRISDTGIGIEEKQLEFIFDAFRQGSEGIGKSHDGGGLGLALCKKLLRLLGGEISVESTPGSGSTFIISFVTAEKIASTEKSREPSIADLGERIKAQLGSIDHKKRILIVEDNLLNAELISQYLEDFFFTDIARTGQLAIKFAWQNEYDLILMDINLGPGMDGIIATREMRTLKNYKDVPFIAVTGYSTDAEKSYIMSNGLDDFLSKPFTREELLEVVGRGLKLAYKKTVNT